MKTLGIAGIFVLLSLGCGPSEPGINFETRYVVMDLEDQTYQLAERPLETLESVVEVRGSALTMRHGGELYAGVSAPETAEEFEQALLVRDDIAPQLDFEMQSNVVVPFDTDSLMMLTAYHHVERAKIYFEGLDLQDSVGPLPTYYRPTVDTGPILLPIPLLTDNAAYAYTLDAFLLPPQFLLSELPLAANRGVMVHEYSHAVFNRVVYNDERVPEYLFEEWPNAAINELRSLDEGVADIFGALETGDANFIEPSITADFGIDRDLAVLRTLDQGLLDTAQNQDELTYNPYDLGSVVASTIWSLLDVFTNEELGALVLDSLYTIRGPGPDFRIVSFFNAFVNASPAAERTHVCERFRERLTPLEASLECAQ